jgi:DNA polymerase III alpha subunit
VYAGEAGVGGALAVPRPPTLHDRPASVAIRVPVRCVKGLTGRTLERLHQERQRGAFRSPADFYRRVVPAPDEFETLIRAGALDGFGQTRTQLFWDAQWLYRRFGQERSGQGWLFVGCSVPAGGPGADGTDAGDESRRGQLPPVLDEPTRRQRLEWESDLFGFTVSGHPLELYLDLQWESYCPVAELGRHIGEEIVMCGLIVEDRIHHQVTGEPMKFLTLCDWTGMVESELFASTYRTYGLATVRYPVLEVAARVEPFENGRGYTLRALRAGKPRMAQRGTAATEDLEKGGLTGQSRPDTRRAEIVQRT